jgi:predicted RNA-binding Zn-ribbon protein involved in translation (DUF1610 family)
MGQFSIQQLKGRTKPMGIGKFVISREWSVPTLQTTVTCQKCGWQGSYAETKIACWIDPVKQTAPDYGGDGRNYYCPKCHQWFASTRGINAELK